MYIFECMDVVLYKVIVIQNKHIFLLLILHNNIIIRIVTTPNINSCDDSSA